MGYGLRKAFWLAFTRHTNLMFWLRVVLVTFGLVAAVAVAVTVIGFVMHHKEARGDQHIDPPSIRYYQRQPDFCQTLQEGIDDGMQFVYLRDYGLWAPIGYAYHTLHKCKGV